MLFLKKSFFYSPILKYFPVLEIFRCNLRLDKHVYFRADTINSTNMAVCVLVYVMKDNFIIFFLVMFENHKYSKT